MRNDEEGAMIEFLGNKIESRNRLDLGELRSAHHLLESPQVGSPVGPVVSIHCSDAVELDMGKMFAAGVG